MKDKALVAALLAVLAATPSENAIATTGLETSVDSSTYGISQANSGPPPSSIVSLFQLSTNSNSLQAKAAADVSGVSGVSVSGAFASPSLGINYAAAEASITYTSINTSGAAANYQFSFLLSGPRLELQDHDGLNSGDYGAPTAIYLAEIFVNGTPFWHSSATLNGGVVGHTLTKDGTDLGGTFFTVHSNSDFGYQFNNFSDVLALGSVADGETLTVKAVLSVSLVSGGFELGSSANIGDPNDLSGTFGLGGNLSVVPEPSSFSLALAGAALIGLRSWTGRVFGRRG